MARSARVKKAASLRNRVAEAMVFFLARAGLTPAETVEAMRLFQSPVGASPKLMAAMTFTMEALETLAEVWGDDVDEVLQMALAISATHAQNAAKAAR